MSTEKAKPTKPRKLSSITQWDIETDVAIVGFGAAGACAAIEAADAGAEAIIFELASSSGGSTALSSAEIYMGGGTRVQKACGIEDDKEDMFKFLMMCGGKQADEAKVRAYCDGSVDHFNWLVANGMPYKDSLYNHRAIMALTDDCLLFTGNEKAWPFKDHAKPSPRGHNLQVEGDNGGPLFTKIITEQVEKRGVRVEYEARALTLITDDAGAVHGLIVRINQKEHAVRARKGVVLCAGGFVMNKEMLKKFAPNISTIETPIGNPGDMGTGILMGMGVGAAAINMNEYFVTLPFYPPAQTTLGIFVNGQGQRFINEDCYHGRVGWHALQQPGDRIYLIIPAENFEQPTYLFADIAGTGETVEELESEIDVPKGMLQHTISYYNEHAARGEDPLFHKDKEWLKPLEGPLAALDCTLGRGAFWPCFTLGGLDTQPTGEVLTAEGEVIPGLYAAGRTACGIPRTGAGYGSGMSVGDASFFGRMAGKAAAARGKA
ncbi:MAG TPA: FAD-dependent oxidoreductase [Pseudomonadales bacterium]